MPTSIHVPDELLAAVDRKAKSLKISRNRLIVRALEREIGEPGWPPGFFEQLRGATGGAGEALRDSLAAVRANRRSKPPVKL